MTVAPPRVFTAVFTATRNTCCSASCMSGACTDGTLPTWVPPVMPSWARWSMTDEAAPEPAVAGRMLTVSVRPTRCAGHRWLTPGTPKYTACMS